MRPDQAGYAGVGGHPLSLDGQPAQPEDQNRRRPDDWQDDAVADADAGNLTRDHQRAGEQGHDAADAEHAEAGHHHLGTEQSHPEEHEQQSSHVNGQDLEREDGQQQAHAAGDTWQHEPGIPELDDQAQHAQAEQQVGELRVGDRAQHALAPRGLDAFDAGPRRTHGDGASVEATHRPAVELPKQVVDILGRQVDERRDGVERFALSERPTFGHRLGRQGGVALPSLSEGPRVSSGIGCGLLCHRVAAGLLPTRRNRMRGTDVGTGRHRGHVGGQGDEESCRGGPGPGRRDEDDHGHRRREHARHDRPGRVEQSTRGSQHQHCGLGVRAGGAREQVVDELRGDRMDDAVVLGDDDARGRPLRASRATAAGELGNHAQAERDEG